MVVLTAMAWLHLSKKVLSQLRITDPSYLVYSDSICDGRATVNIYFGVGARFGGQHSHC